MVRFTLFCRDRGSRMRMEFPDDDRVWEIDEAVRETLGCEEFMLRNGYRNCPDADTDMRRNGVQGVFKPAYRRKNQGNINGKGNR